MSTATVGNAVDLDGARAARLVAREVQVHGEGPTWAELGEALGWSLRTGRARIPELRRAGWLHYSSKTRSLRPGRRYDPRSTIRPGATARERG